MKKIYFTIAAIGFSLCASTATAQVRDKSFKDWITYTTKIDGKTLCYIASFPVSKTGNYTKRDDPYFIVTSLGKAQDEVSLSSGYPYKDNSKIQVTIEGGKTHYLSLVKGDNAWTKDARIDKDLISEIKHKAFMNVKGTSNKGTYSVDRYSLSGFSAAYDRMKELCK